VSRDLSRAGAAASLAPGRSEGFQYEREVEVEEFLRWSPAVRVAAIS